MPSSCGKEKGKNRNSAIESHINISLFVVVFTRAISW